MKVVHEAQWSKQITFMIASKVNLLIIFFVMDCRDNVILYRYIGHAMPLVYVFQMVGFPRSRATHTQLL